jgi:DNA-binding XRE family transcriptional regulator
MRYAPNFKEPRLNAGLTQHEVATKLGKTQPTVQKWESGAFSPSMEDLCRLAELYNVVPSAFFRLKDTLDVVAVTNDGCIVFECRHTDSDAHDAGERLCRQLRECSAALSTVPQDFADHWIAALKACASIANEMKHSFAEKMQKQSSTDPAIRGANETMPPGARSRPKSRKPVLSGERIP